MTQNVMTNFLFYASVKGVGQEGPVIYTRSYRHRGFTLAVGLGDPL